MNFNELNSALSSQGAQWIANENEISRLSDSAKKQMLGATPPAGYTPPAQVARVTAAEAVNLPTSIDWRNNNGNFVTAVKNQGGCGSCVSFGTMAAMETRNAIEHAMLLDFSEADMFFCSSHGASCDGWWPSSAYQANQTRGIIQECLFPYATAFPGNNINNPSPTCKNVPNRADNAFIYGTINSITTINDTKSYLVNNGPLACVFQVYEDFFNYQSGIYTHTSGQLAGLHCVCIVGYNDNNGNGYWICKNSWGTGWGMSGYFYIAYNQCMIDTYEKVGVTGITTPTTTYVSIGSQAFPNVFMRMDGSGVTQPTGPGGGTVNCQYTAGPWEQFALTKQADGSYTIGSQAFPNVFMRMDGTGVTQPTGPGGGTVNCQFTAGPWEQFSLTKQASGAYTIESVAFPNVYMRMDGSGVTQPTGPGGGVDNCQYTAGPWEQFILTN